MDRFKVVATAIIEYEIIKTGSKDVQLDIMMASQPIYPILEARRVAKWFDIDEEKAEDLLEDLFVRNHFWRKKDKRRNSWLYSESTRALGLSDAEVERQRKHRVTVRKIRIRKGKS
jgi:hypothetical protein